MGLLTSPRTYAGLAAFQAADAVACAAQVAPIRKSLDSVGCPDSVRRVLPVVKGASAVGLLSVKWFPGLARLTTAMLIWFVIDSAFSVSTGFALNAVSNIVLVILLMVPLLASGALKSAH